MIQRLRFVVGLLLAGGLAGCGASQAQPPAMPQLPPPEVLVSTPVTREVHDYEDFPGRMEAVDSIEIRARVTGYLDQVHFREGAEVQEGDPLFEIDPRPYEGELARAEGMLVQSEGRLKRLESDSDRAKTLLPKGAITREEYDRIASERIEAMGAVSASKATRDIAKLNLSFTKVTAPIRGRISRRLLDPGNLVKADETVLTWIVSLDPIYVYFDLDERTTLRLQRAMREGKVKWSMEEDLPPLMLGLGDEEGFPREGRITFAENRVDPDTGTWRLRGEFTNSDSALAPGMFVRVRLPIGAKYTALLISEQALITDQGQKFVYVIGDEGKVEYRRVKVGRQHAGYRVIADGLTSADRIVVNGLQRVIPGGKVNPKLVEMPSAISAPVEEEETAPAKPGDNAKSGSAPEKAAPKKKSAAKPVTPEKTAPEMPPVTKPTAKSQNDSNAADEPETQKFAPDKNARRSEEASSDDTDSNESGSNEPGQKK